MKRFIIAALLVACSQAWGCNYELRIVQRNSTDTSSFTRQICPPNGDTLPSLMVHDPFTGQVQMGVLAGFSWDGTTLTAVGTQADWNASTGPAVILNKPALATVATSGSYNDLSNKPTIPTILARSFSYPTRSLATCFQLSTTRDAQVSYGVDISTTVTLGGTPQGTVFLRTYTNSACNTGQQTIISSTAGQPTTLSITVGQQMVGTANLSGVIPAGTWVQIESVSNSGTPTFTPRQGQEVLL